MRVAVVGKGGSGKTVIAATLARVLARSGRRVVAADLDTNPGLAFSLGVAPDDAGLAPEVLERDEAEAYGWGLATGVEPEVALARSARLGPDGVRYISLGKIVDVDKSELRQSCTALRQILSKLQRPGWDVIGDLEAGPTTPYEGYHGFAEVVVVVVTPAWASALAARRLVALVDPTPTIVVANRFRDEPDHTDLAPVVRIPFDAGVADAERVGLAALDHCPGSPALQAIGELAELLMMREAAACESC